MAKEYKPLEKIVIDPNDNFTNNGQIKNALVRIGDLKKEIENLKAENDALKQRIKLLEGHLKK